MARERSGEWSVSPVDGGGAHGGGFGGHGGGFGGHHGGSHHGGSHHGGQHGHQRGPDGSDIGGFVPRSRPNQPFGSGAPDFRGYGALLFMAAAALMVLLVILVNR